MNKPYTTLKLTEGEFTDLRAAVSAQRDVVLGKCALAPVAGGESAFYMGRAKAYDALLRRFDEVLIADTSQDHVPDDDDEDAP